MRTQASIDACVLLFEQSTICLGDEGRKARSLLPNGRLVGLDECDRAIDGSLVVHQKTV